MNKNFYIGEPVSVLASVDLLSPNPVVPTKMRVTKEPELAWIVEYEPQNKIVKVLTNKDFFTWCVSTDCLNKFI